MKTFMLLEELVQMIENQPLGYKLHVCTNTALLWFLEQSNNLLSNRLHWVVSAKDGFVQFFGKILRLLLLQRK
jgi:hypothetical protein